MGPSSQMTNKTMEAPTPPPKTAKSGCSYSWKALASAFLDPYDDLMVDLLKNVQSSLRCRGKHSVKVY